jgi:asparagine synthase (glutamine-hydrolysing)
MCGLNGIFAYKRSAGLPKQAELLATRDAMIRRGPDGAGEWWSKDRRLGLGHRRLSILDLSERASQPMVSACGRYVVVFNGEIYNYPVLRRELEAQGAVFRTTSDTEVLLHLFAREGAALPAKLRGMFAFAIWDETKRRLFLARDPYGIKPLYTSNDGWTFRLASQVKALLAGGGVSRDPEPAGIVGFHTWGSVPEPFTLYRDIRALPAGHSQWIDEAGPHEPKPFASITQIFADGAANPAPADEISARVRAAALESVSAHLLADVEVGVFLSAGIDSGALLGLMRDAGQKQIRAITLAFEEFRGTPEDEAPLAGEIAQIYGAEHIVRRVSAAEFRADLPLILAAMDQPSIDGVNTWFVAKAAREAGLKVALSGLGGDEILAGYPSFHDIPKWVRWLRIPASVPGLGVAARLMLSALRIAKTNPKALGLLEYGGSYPGAYLLRRGLMLPFELKRVLDADTVHIGLCRLMPLHLLATSIEPMPSMPMSRVAALESANYMRNQLLRDTDWASMAHSVEVRTPLVDFELLKALSPVTAQLGPGDGKRALGAAPQNSLLGCVINRHKSGFEVPLGDWMKADAKTGVLSRRLQSRTVAQRVLLHPSFDRTTPTIT